jgi:hypothetical protein
MSKLSAIWAVVMIAALQSYSQHILFQSNLETIPLVFPDSLPAGWKKMDVDQNNPVLGWAVNDTNQHFGGDTSVFKPRAHSGKKCLFIFWLAGLGNTNLNDDWVWTDSLRIQTGDSLIFWCLLGSTPLIAPYPDSVQVHVCSAQNPNSSILKLITIKSNDSLGYPMNNNTWREFKFNLSQFAGQRIYIAWRYYMVISLSSGLWINIDDIMIGNRFPIGIIKINNSVPEGFGLGQNYPNPFNPSTKIKFDIPSFGTQEPVQLRIFDILGREVSRPVNQLLQPGTYEYSFDAAHLSSGIYYYRLTYGNYSETKKMVLSR